MTTQTRDTMTLRCAHCDKPAVRLTRSWGYTHRDGSITMKEVHAKCRRALQMRDFGWTLADFKNGSP